MSEYILETVDLSKTFKKHEVVKKVSLKVERNTIYGLLGPNGAGKSTTLKMVAGALSKSSGEIYFDGHKWSRDDLKNIGSLIETPPLYDNLSAIENLKVRTLLLDIPNSRIKEVLEIVDLIDTGKKKAGQFSLGMKQRLGIAIALLNNPKLLILDEPTNGLDPVGIRELRELIKSFPKRGITVIISSHNLPEIQQVADHIGIISNGILEYQSKITLESNLESLFIDIVEKQGKGGR